MKSYGYLFMSPHERGLIWHFLRREVQKSLSIDRLVTDVNQIQAIDHKDITKWYKAGIRP